MIHLARYLPAIWLGILIGVSFIATPVKFKAASLTLPVALDIGQRTFHLFTKVEWGLAIAWMLVLVNVKAPGILLGLGAALAVTLAIQTFALLPALDARVAQIIAGTPPPRSAHHLMYALLEGGKALLLVAALTGVIRGLPHG